jgi:DNA-binding FadR family transcriptional regulator
LVHKSPKKSFKISSTIRKRPRLAETVVKDLVTKIVTEVYPPQSALPPEPALCEHYQVSRTVIREATTALVGKGLVSSEQGRGTIVKSIEEWALLDSMVLFALFQRKDGLRYIDNLIEIRAALESSMAAKAALNASARDIQDLTTQFYKLDLLVKKPAAYAQEDVQFHRIIMRLSGDILSQAIISNVQSMALHTYIYKGKDEKSYLTDTHRAHKKIFDSIINRDDKLAAKLMKDHIESSWQKRRLAPLK